MLSIGKPLMMKLTSTLLIIVLNYLELVTGENADFIGIRSFGGDGGMSAVGVAIYSSDQSILVYGQMSLNFIAPFTCPQLAGTTAGGIDLYLARFRSNGTMLWCIRFGSTNDDFAMMSENSKASPMIESGTGDIVIAGIITGLTGISNSPNAAGRIFDQSCPAGNNFCTLISRFSSSGGHLRSRVFGTNTRVAGVRLVPNSESLIVVGSTFGSMLGANGPGGWDFYVMRMTMTKSNNEWTISNSPPVIWGSTNEELALAMDFDPVNKIVYVAGRCRGPFDGAARAVGDLDIFITRFRESGTESFQSLGTLIFGSVAFDLVRDILFDASSGALYLCGTFGTSAVIDGLPVQLANTGRQQFLYKRFFNGTDGWIKTYGGFGNDDQASSLSIQPGTGNIVLSGFLNGQMAYTLADIPQPYYGNYDVSVFVLNPRDGSIILFRTAGTTASDSVSDTYFLPDNKTLAMAGRWANFAGYYLIDLSQQKQAKPASRQVVVNTTVIIPTFLSTSTVIVPISETRIPFPITQYDVFPTTQTEYLETCTITNLENYYAPTCNPPINRCGLYGEGGALQDSVVFKSPFFITAVSFLGILFTALSVVIYLLYGRLLVSKKAKKESEVTSNVLDGLTSLVAAQAMSQMFSTHTQMAAQQQLPMSRPGSIYQMHGSGPLIQDVSNMPMARPQSAGNYASSRASLHNPAAAGSYGNFRQSNYLEDYN